LTDFSKRGQSFNIPGERSMAWMCAREICLGPCRRMVPGGKGPIILEMQTYPIAAIRCLTRQIPFEDECRKCARSMIRSKVRARSASKQHEDISRRSMRNPRDRREPRTFASHEPEPDLAEL